MSMIAWIKGKIVETDLRSVILDVNGIGYRIYTTSETLNEISHSKEKEIQLWIHHVVREDAEDLYGFFFPESLILFEQLITVSGIGPKSALNILNIATVETIHEAIQNGETTYLTKVSGIGKKIAEKIVIELRDKVIEYNPKNIGAVKESELAVEALKSLGYSEREAREAIKKIGKENQSTEDLIKKALKNLN